MDEKVFRKTDLSSRHPIFRNQQSAINKLFRDDQMAQQIRKLDLSNLCVLNWQIDNQLQEFILLCPQLEALHVLNCGMSLRTLHRILKQATKLTSLSWSLRDLTSEDIEFLKSMESSDSICLKNLKHLHLETLQSLPHIQIVKYLVLSHCKYLEELEIYTWLIYKSNRPGLSIPQPATSVADVLQHLHSLTVVSVGGSPYYCHLGAQFNRGYFEELRDFVFSVVRKKSSLTKWKKLWLVPPIGNSRQQDIVHLTQCSVPLHKDRPHELQSVEAIAAHADCGPHTPCNALDEWKALLQRIDDNTVKSVHLCQPVRCQQNLIAQLYEPIIRIGGHVLKFLSLSHNCPYAIDAEKVVFLHTLFSKCSNITQLDLLLCCFEKDICEALSELKHLTNVQLKECAISSKYSIENQMEISTANLLTFVENCKNITHLEVRGCYHCRHVPSLGPLLELTKLRNLKSLTLYRIFSIRDWTFLHNISEHCKFLTMLRISDVASYNNSQIPLIIFESARFLKHLAIEVPVMDMRLESFWNLLSCATNLERLCIRSYGKKSLNIPVAVEKIKSLPQLHVLHLHSGCEKDAEVFHDQMMRMLEEEKSDRRFFFELVMDYYSGSTRKSLISNKVLPCNKVELCHMTPVVAIPKF